MPKATSERARIKLFQSGDGVKLLDSLASRFSDGEYADLNIRCGSKVWRVHKVIVCGQSDFFKNACKKQYKEGQTGVIDLLDDDASMVDAMLRFFYMHDYSHPKTSKQLVVHPLVYAIAEKYEISGLEKLAKSKFESAATSYWESHDFHSAIRLIYTTTPPQNRGLRQAVIDLLLTEEARWFKRLMVMESFRERMEDVSEFSVDLAVKLAGAPSGPPPKKIRFE